MNEQNFKKLCHTCDEILTSHTISTSKVAIPWLHIIREHPIFLKRYECLFSLKNSLEVFKCYIENLKIILNGLFYFLKSSLLGSNTVISKKIINTDNIFVSHILNGNQSFQHGDFYFGECHKLLNQANKKTILVLLNHSRINNKKLIKNYSKLNTPRIILGTKISIFRGVKFYFQMIKTCLELIFKSLKQKTDFKKSVYINAAINALSSGTFANLRLESQVKEIVQKCNCSNIITTYEGHAYERLVFHGAKNANPKIVCVGYQHSSVLKLQHSFKRSISKNFDSDFLFTSSLQTKNVLLKDNKMKWLKIEVLGSRKSIKIKTNQILINNNCCLVLPEGEISECEILFKNSLKCALKLPHINFIWRLHPILNFDRLREETDLLSNLPPNIILSKKTLFEDIKSSSFALYRGSTSVIEAVSYGLIPIYFKSRENELTIDPLYNCEGVNVVNNSNELINFFKSSKNNLLTKSTVKTMKYAQNYFDPLNCNVFNKLQ